MSNPLITIEASTESGYRPRTLYNAQSSDLTLAFAADFSTAGELLTKKAAGPNKYVAINLLTDSVDAAVARIYNQVVMSNASVLNIAGNGIYTLSEFGISQYKANQYVFEVLSRLHEKSPISMIKSGGQTGIDIAGLVAGAVIGVPVKGTLPPNFVQRHQDKKDTPHTSEDIVNQILAGAEVIKKEVEERKARLHVEVVRNAGHPWDSRAGFDIMYVDSSYLFEFNQAVKSAESKYWKSWGTGFNFEANIFSAVMFKPCGISEDWEDSPKDPHPGIIL